MLKSITDLLQPSVWATYIVGFSAIAIGLWQFNRAFRLNKKAAVFEELSKDIQHAVENVDKISSATSSVIDQLARAANSASYDPTGKTEQERNAEIDRRIKDLDAIANEHKAFLTNIYESYRKVLLLIKKIEKSTVVSEKSRKAARYLFYAATDQHELVQAVSKVLQSFRVTPALGDNPNISSETFNEFNGLVRLINSKNETIKAYLDDLEIILHNDLVRRLFGRAKLETIPPRHLSSNGLKDKRVEESLL